MATPSKNLKRYLGVTLDGELVDQLKKAAKLQAAQRHIKNPKVSAYLNELLHKVLPAELQRLQAPDNIAKNE